MTYNYLNEKRVSLTAKILRLPVGSQVYSTYMKRLQFVLGKLKDIEAGVGVLSTPFGNYQTGLNALSNKIPNLYDKGRKN